MWTPQEGKEELGCRAQAEEVSRGLGGEGSSSREDTAEQSEGQMLVLSSACQPVTPSGSPYRRVGATPLLVAEGPKMRRVCSLRSQHSLSVNCLN